MQKQCNLYLSLNEIVSLQTQSSEFKSDTKKYSINGFTYFTYLKQKQCKFYLSYLFIMQKQCKWYFSYLFNAKTMQIVFFLLI